MKKMTKINAGVAMVKVFEAWGIDHIYGIPGGSFNSTMDALYQERESVRYIQVRHEEAGALAAAADAKLTGKVGAVFGSAGPGATHLINGLYDAQMDNVPVVALLGQVASSSMNYNDFQEMNENPMFADVSIYNRTVRRSAQLGGGGSHHDDGHRQKGSRRLLRTRRQASEARRHLQGRRHDLPQYGDHAHVPHDGRRHHARDAAEGGLGGCQGFPQYALRRP